MKRLAKYLVVGGVLPFAVGPVLAPSVAQENVKGISLRLGRTFSAPRKGLRLMDRLGSRGQMVPPARECTLDGATDV